MPDFQEEWDIIHLHLGMASDSAVGLRSICYT